MVRKLFHLNQSKIVKAQFFRHRLIKYDTF